MDDQQARFWNMWEEKAFAEDAFLWPPRSYSCSFCGREFKSAQALGGHMNVHRRDRARVQLQPPVKSIQNPTVEFPNRVCSMIYPPNIVSHNSGELLASSLSHIPFPTVSSTQKSIYDQSVVLSTVQDHLKSPFYSFPPSPSDSTSDPMRLFNFLDSKIEEGLIKKQKARSCEADIIKYDHVPSTRVSLNLQVISSEIEETTSCKQRRTDHASPPFFLKAAIEDNLDLELRLGW